jgi:transaldolase
MKFSLDSADLDELRLAEGLGILGKVTTNPSHMAKAGVRDMRQHVRKMAEITDAPISCEVTATETDQMLTEARDIATWAPNVVVKFPMTLDGLRAINASSEETHVVEGTDRPARKVPVNATVIFSVGQAVAAVAAGASYVSPFVGRLDAVGQEGLVLLREIADVLKAHDSDVQIISAALRNPIHVSESWRAGAHICTASWAVIEQCLSHPLTDAAVEGFTRDWEAAKNAAGLS